MRIAVLPILYRTFAVATFAGLLSAQVQFTVTPNPVVFGAVPAATLQSQTVTITTNVPTPVSVQVPSYFQPFLSVSSVPAATAGIPPTAQFTVTVDTHGFAASTVPNQFLMIVGVPGTSNQVQVPVNVIVTGPLSPLASSPASLTFSYQTSGSLPAQQPLTITSLTGAPQTFSLAASSSGWLGVSANTGNTATAGTVNVFISSAGLIAGSYDGGIIVTPASGNPFTVPVHLDVTASPQVSIGKSALSFVWQTTTGLPGLPAPQTVSLGSSNPNSKLFFSATPTVDPADPMWLVVTPNSGFTNADIQIALNTQVVSTMSLGKHNATVNIDAPGTIPSRQPIQVSFTIANGPLLTVSPGSLAFSMAATGALPDSQTINVASTSAATPINAFFTPVSGGAWATVVVTSSTTPVSTPAQVQISISPLAQSLAAQTYTGTVTINTTTDRQDIPITLTVSNVPVLNAAPGSLTFAYQIARTLPVDQFFQITSSGFPIGYTVAATSTGGWLKINVPAGLNLTTPSSLIVSIDRAVLLTLAPNAYSGAIVLTRANGQTLSLPVTLNVSQNALLQAYPAQLEYTFQPGDSRVQRKDISVTSTGDPFVFNVAVAGGFWLSALGSTNQTTSANITIQVDASALSPGIYTGIVTFIPAGQFIAAVNPAVSIPIKVTVAAGSLMSDKSGLSFIQVAGGSIPAPQAINVSNPAGAALNFSASVQMDTGGNWLSVTPLNGATPQALTVSIANTAGLLAGTTYTGAVVLQAPGASNSPQVIRVTFTVVPPQTITVPVTPLSFTSTAGAAPATQSVAISGSSQGLSYTTTVSTQSGGEWLVVSPANGSLPALLNVSISTAVLATLAPGTYSGSIRLDAQGTTNSPQTIPVSLVVGSVTPTVTTVRNSASYQAGAIAPGEILYIEGSAMGPAALTIASPNPTWPTTLANVQVTFDGIAAPILYVMNNKLSVVVPWAIFGRTSTQMVVKYQNQTSNTVNLQVTTVAPGIYTSDSSGAGQAAILNYHSNGTVDVNSSNRPIERGGAIAVYGTGGGLTTPLGVDGAVTPAILYPFNANVTAFIGGQPMTVLYSGGAPGLLSGAMQVNILIPADAPTGFQPLVILVNGVPTQANTMVTIQ
jgi:uncharacterized protein (TIGR03437 family)